MSFLPLIKKIDAAKFEVNIPNHSQDITEKKIQQKLKVPLHKQTLLHNRQGFLGRGSTSGRHFGQNGQQLHENYKINILGAKQWGGAWGDDPIFRLVEGIPPRHPNYGKP